MCSPTRAALLTGLNPHAAGVGHVAHSDPGFPGYAMELADRRGDVGRAAARRRLRDADGRQVAPGQGLRLLRRRAAALVAVPARLRPLLRLPRRLHQPAPPAPAGRRTTPRSTSTQYPDGYYLTDDLTDRAIEMIQSVKASDPSKPFFLYFAHGAVHAPLHAKADDIARYAGRYDAGWDALRERALRPADRARHPAAGARSCRRATASAATTSSPWDDLACRAAGAVRALHGGLRRRWSTTSTSSSAGCWRRSTRWASSTTRSCCSPVRQRRLPRGRGRGHHGLLPAPARYDGPRRRPRAARRDRRADDDAALPARLGDGVAHAVPALQDQHPRRAGTRCRWCWPGPGVGEGTAAAVRARHRRAADAARPARGRAARRPRSGIALQPLAGASFAPVIASADAAVARTRSSTTRWSATAATTGTAGRW